jgi:hypothetical protein
MKTQITYIAGLLMLFAFALNAQAQDLIPEYTLKRVVTSYRCYGAPTASQEATTWVQLRVSDDANSERDYLLSGAPVPAIEKAHVSGIEQVCVGQCNRFDQCGVKRYRHHYGVDVYPGAADTFVIQGG